MNRVIRPAKRQQLIQLSVVLLCTLLVQSVAGAAAARAQQVSFQSKVGNGVYQTSNSSELLYDAAKPAARAIPVSYKPRVRVIMMEVTAYCPCKKCCGPNARGVTASGKTVRYNGGRFAAADTDVLPMGSKLKVPGYNASKAIEVIDTGSAIKGNKLDVYFSSHKTAQQWGVRLVPVTVVD
jgi:3D (Asp-Asp-Asp) domain-containing protein